MRRSILVNCPGGWSHGLDSPERGEGRWAQNLAKVLARSGRYQVFCSSGGPPTWGRGEPVDGVALLSESEANKLSVDLYLDSSWYQGKPALGTAKAYLHAYWSPEDWMLQIPLPPNHYVLYVYRHMADCYLVPRNINRTFYLPAPFAAEMTPPNPKARRVLSLARQRDARCNAGSFEQLYEAVRAVRQSEPIQLVWMHHPAYTQHNHIDDLAITHAPGQPWGIPYCELLMYIRGAGLNATFGGGGSVADCAVRGVPSLVRESAFDFIVPVAKQHGLLMSHDCSAAQIEDAIRRLYGDSQLYCEYTVALQDVYRDHLDGNVLRLFDSIADEVLQ